MFGATFDFANSDVTMLGGRGDDIIQDYDDSSLIRGQRDNDTIKAGGGPDVIFGNKGDDVLKGGNGADLIDGGRDDDQMTGGSGRDTFIFGRNHGTDVILDFADNFDQLDLSAFGFASAAEVRAEAEDIGSSVEIDLTGQGGGILVIEDFTRASITSADLIL